MSTDAKQRYGKHDTIAIAILVVVAVALCVPMFRSGTLPVDTRALLDAPPWRDLAQPPQAPKDDTYAATESLIRYPNYAFTAQSTRRGDSLQWSPLEYGGTPFLAQWTTGALSPFSFPVRIVPLDTALRISALLKLLAAALCMYLAARALGLVAPFALAAALTYGFAGGMLLWLGHASSDVAPWLPLFFLGADRIASGVLRAWPIAALGATLMLLGGDPVAAFAGIGVGAIYLVMRLTLWRGAPRRVLSVLVFAFACAVGLAGAAAQILPWLEYREWATQWRAFALGVPSAMDVIRSIFAPLAALPADSGSGLLPREQSLFHVGSLFVLIGVVWVAIRPHVMREHRSRVDALILGAAVVIGFAAIPASLQAARGESPIGYHQVLLFLPLALGLIAATAMQAWLELDPAQCTRALRRLAWFVPAYLACFAILVASDGLRGASGPALGTAGLAIEFALVAAALALLALTLYRPSHVLAGYGIALLCGIGTLAAVPAHMTFGAPPSSANHGFIDAIAETRKVIAGSDALHRWPLAAHGIRQTHGAAAIPSDAMRAYLESHPREAAQVSDRLLLTTADLDRSYAHVRSELTMLAAFPQGVALFEKPGVGSRLAFAELPLDGEYPVATIVSETNTRVTIAAAVPVPVRLILRDSFHPAWKATVDGEPVAITPHEGAFRSVEIPAGRSRIVFSYAPESWRSGLLISGGALIAMLAGFGFIVVRATRMDSAIA